MLDGFGKGLFVFLRQVQQRLAEKDGKEFPFQIVSHLPHRGLKLGARHVSIGVGYIDSFGSLTAKFEGLRDAVRVLLFGEQIAAQIQRQAREADADVRIWPQPCRQLFCFSRVDVITRGDQLKVLSQEDRDRIRQRNGSCRGPALPRTRAEHDGVCRCRPGCWRFDQLRVNRSGYHHD